MRKKNDSDKNEISVQEKTEDHQHDDSLDDKNVDVLADEKTSIGRPLEIENSKCEKAITWNKQTNTEHNEFLKQEMKKEYLALKRIAAAQEFCA